MPFRIFGTLGLLCVLLESAGVGQLQSGVGGGQAPAQPRTVSGVVINSVTGRPIARALVQAGSRAMLTDSEGHFAFQGVTEPYAIPFARKPGFFSESPGDMMSWSPPAPEQTGPVEVRLVPEAILSGLVTDVRGASLEGVRIQLRTLVVSNGWKHWEQRMSTTTNAGGEFRFAELQAGEYSLETALKLDGPPEGTASAGYAPVQYPALGVNGAGALQLHAGDHLEAAISTRLERLYPVSGVVRGLPDGVSPSITARTAGGQEFSPEVRVNPSTGEFRITLPSGSFELRAQASIGSQTISTGSMTSSGPALQLLGREQLTVAQGPVSGVRMTLEPMATLAVDVAEEKTAHAQDNRPPSRSPESTPVNLILWPTEAEATQTAYYAARDTGTDLQQQKNGPLLIRNIPPGQYFLQAQPQPPWYVASALCGGTDLIREHLTFTGSAAACALHVVLRDDAASLKVSVLHAGGDHASPVLILAVPMNNLTRDLQTFATGPGGQAALEAVAPGQYLLLATRQGAQLAYRDPESLQRYEAEGRRVDLTPGGNAEVQLDVIAGEP